MLRRTASESSLRTVLSADNYPSPYPNDVRRHQRLDYHLIDPQRPREPIFCKALTPAAAQEWAAFMRATATLGPPLPPNAPRPPRDWLETHPSGLEAPWIPPEKGLPDVPPWPQRIMLALARHPAIPLALRVVVWAFSLTALILGAKLLRNEFSDLPPARRTSPIMAVAVDSVALVYLILVARDEFSGGQVGLRDAGAKLRLILLDLFFIVFAAANLALAFDSLVEPDGGLAGLETQRSLAAVLLLALIAWMATFSVSALGIVSKVTG